MALVGARPASVLAHPTRERIYNHLLRLPGDHFRSIVRSLNLGLGTVLHHLNTLANTGYVRLQKTNGRARYYATGRDAVPQLNHVFQQHWIYRDSRLRVLFAARRMKDARAAAIARNLGMSRQLVSYHLRQLVEAGHLKRDGSHYVPVVPASPRSRR